MGSMLRRLKLPKLKPKTVSILVIALVVVIILATQISTEGFSPQHAWKYAPQKTHCFNAVCYTNRYPDLKNAFGTASNNYSAQQLWSHWYFQGYTEGRNPCCDAPPPPAPPPPAPPPPPPPTYEVIPRSIDTGGGVISSIDEGSPIMFIVKTKNVPDGTVLFWSSTHVEDTTPGTGTVTIKYNTGQFVLTVHADVKTEGAEKFVVNLRKTASGPIIAASVPVTINDTSTSCPPSGSQTWIGGFGGFSAPWGVPWGRKPPGGQPPSCPRCYTLRGYDWTRAQYRCEVP
jgi:hypothetical protein